MHNRLQDETWELGIEKHEFLGGGYKGAGSRADSLMSGAAGGQHYGDYDN